MNEISLIKRAIGEWQQRSAPAIAFPEATPEITPVSSSHGGSRIYRAGGLFIKLIPEEPMALSEWKGLVALHKEGWPTPRPIGYSVIHNVAILGMEWLETSSSAGKKRETTPEDRLRLFTDIYATAGQTWGTPWNSYIASVPLPSGMRKDFTDFWLNARIAYLVRMARERSLLDQKISAEIEKATQQKIEVWQLDKTSPRLIHGDLWSGNLIITREGSIFFIDPSACYSHPEQDLAMLMLFGSPIASSELSKIAESTGSPPGFQERVPFWQIYPLLVHLILFGRSYAGQLSSALSRIR